ncbi:MAG TPA: FAD-dependent monooxygenase, partial [Thermoanaerobaculia bacterium]|nr:FAD-dependent monooxygenase [Thermoanaerobaculia bacterium]
MSSIPVPCYDALVIGGGPAGATAALSMVRAGLSVRLVERTPHPRFHVGESFLPRNLTLLRDLGLEPALQSLTHVAKHGAEFLAGDGSTGYLFSFQEALLNPEPAAFNIERAPFDAMILDAARAAGTEVTEGVAVREIPVLEDGRVEAVLDTGERIAARYLVACCGGRSTIPGALDVRWEGTMVLSHNL